MRRVGLFVEDFGHEVFLKALVQRLADEYEVAVEMTSYSVRGGHGKVLAELKQYIRDLQRGRESTPDLLIVGTDGNCKRFSERKQEIDRAAAGFIGQMIYAIPDPHIERWLLLDSGAFKAVLGKGCAAPDQKCERDRYKDLLRSAVLDAGVMPLLGGIEHAETLVNAMNLQYLERVDDSLEKLVKALRDRFREWEDT